MTSKAARLIYSHRRAFEEKEEERPVSGPPKRKRASKKVLPRTHRTLAVLLESLRDEKLVFELKCDTEITGFLYDVDPNLNVNLVDARIVTRRGSRPAKLESTYVSGSSIRYVRLPDKVDAMRALDRYLDARARISRKETRQKRAEDTTTRTRHAPPPIDLPAPALRG